MDNETLQNIIKGYSCNIMGYLGKIDYSSANAEIEFPISLLKDIIEKEEFTCRGCDYPVLEEHCLPRNFNLDELMLYITNAGGMKQLEGWYVYEIKNISIIGQRVHLDVLVNPFFNL